MEMPSLFACLQASTFAGDFAPEVLQQLADFGRWKYCPSGSVIFREGDLNPFFYLIQSGNIAIEMCIPARGCQRLLTLGPSDILAWSALLDEGRMTSTAVAIGDSQLMEFSGTHLRTLCETVPGFGYRLMQRTSQALAQRLVATRLQMLDMYRIDTTAGGTFS